MKETVYTTSVVISLQCADIATMPFPTAHSIPLHKCIRTLFDRMWVVTIVNLLLETIPLSSQQNYQQSTSEVECNTS